MLGLGAAPRFVYADDPTSTVTSEVKTAEDDIQEETERLEAPEGSASVVEIVESKDDVEKNTVTTDPAEYKNDLPSVTVKETYDVNPESNPDAKPTDVVYTKTENDKTISDEDVSLVNPEGGQTSVKQNIGDNTYTKLYGIKKEASGIMVEA